MKLTILGTGNATVSECYNTCYAISDEGKHFLVDAGGWQPYSESIKRHRKST